MTPFSGTWNRDAVRHLLRRTTFGASAADVQRFLGLGLSASLDLLLDDSIPLPQPPQKEYATTGATTPDTAIAVGQTWVNDPNNDGTIASLRRASFKKWWIGTMIGQSSSLREKMTLFWHNHYATETADVGNAQYVYKHHLLFRTHALGNVKQLTRLISTDPAMLVYLNGQNNNKTAPDENFAREIQELFVIGKGPGAGFTEADVKAAARVLTGWRNNSTTLSSYFDSSRHDITTKQFSSFYGNKLIAGRTGSTAGELELTELIDMLYATEEAALFLSRKLYTWFAHYRITPEIESAVIVPMATLLRQSGFEVKPVLRALLGSKEFFDVGVVAAQIKSPVDLMIGFMREFEVAFPPKDQFTVAYGLWNFLAGYMNNLQQNIGDPPDVSGWKAYYQEPGFYKYWINSDTLPKRVQYLDNLINSGYTFSGFKMIPDGLGYVKNFTSPGDPNALVGEMVSRILAIPISTAHQQQLKKDILLGGQSEDYYWTNAWDTYVLTPSNVANTKYVSNAITGLIRYLVDLPEYQLC